MKNTKLIALGLVSTLFIVSCGKEVTTTTQTGVISTGTTTQTGVISTGTLASTGVVQEAPVLENKIEVTGENSVLTNPDVGYEITYKVTDELTQQTQEGIDLFLIHTSGNMFSIVTAPFQDNTLEEYLDKGIEEMKAEINDVKKESVDINGAKGFKITYNVNQLNFEQYIFEGKNKKVILISKTYNDKNLENFESVLNTFKLK